jgi:prepilin-type N-terminal cleavage/methylation domain-containing protein
MNKSFTLIEILVVIVVIGVLSAFILVGMSSVTSSANIAKSQAFSNSLRNSLLINLVSEWKFEGPTPAESTVTTNDAKDSWGSNNITTVGGNPVVKNSNCVSGKCIFFDGTGDYVSILDSNSLDVTDGITISVWVNVASVQNTNYEYIVRKTAVEANQGTLYGLLMGYNNKIVRLFIWTEDSAACCSMVVDSVTQLDLNKWYYLSATYDAASHTGRMYINGVLDKTNTNAGSTKIRTNNNILYISQIQDGTLYFNGYMDEVALYNQAMSASNVSEKYYSGLNKLFKNNGIGSEEYSLRISQLKEVLTKN